VKLHGHTGTACSVSGLGCGAKSRPEHLYGGVKWSTPKQMMQKWVKFILALFLSVILPIGYYASAVDEGYTSQRLVLGNGLTLIVTPLKNKEIVSINLTVNAGLSSENEYAGTGITHFIEHMLFKGTPTRTSEQIRKEIKSYGGYMNASTGLDTTSFVITVPSKYFRPSLDLIADMVMNSVFDEKEFEKERSVILKEIRLHNDDPSTEVIKILFENAYLVHSYRYPVIGLRELFKKLGRDDLVFYHNNYYVPNNMVMAIAGDIKKNEAINAIEQSFGQYEMSPRPIVINNPEPQQIAERTINKPKEINLGYLSIGFHSTEILNSDLFALDVLAMALGSGDGSRLNKTLVKEKELLYTVGCANYTPKYPGLFIVTGIGKPENLELSVSKIKEEIDFISSNGITLEEFEKAKANVLSSYLHTLEETDSIAANACQGEMLTGDFDFAKKYIAGIKSLELDDVKRVGKLYLKNENCTVAYLRSEKSEAREQRAEGRRQKAATEGSPERSLELVERRSRGKDRRQEEKEEKIESKAKKYTLSNGIRVLLKEERNLPLISVVFSCLGGLRAESKDLSGISNLTSKMLLKGTKIRKEHQIKPAMENIGAGINAFSGMNSFGLAMEFMTSDQAFAIELLEDVVKNSDFPDDEIKKVKEKIFAALRAEDDDIFQKGLYELRRGLFKNHPYSLRILGSQETIRRITRDDILRFYRSLISTENIVITAVGDFDANAMLRRLSKRFGNIKGSGAAIDILSDGKIKKQIDEKFFMPKEQALFVLGFRGVTVKNPDRYNLEVLSSVMSGSDGRIFHCIRDNLGLSYTQGASQVAGVDPGYFFFYVATDAKNINKAGKVIQEEIAKIKKIPLGDAELGSAKSSLIGNHLMSIQTNSAKAFTMALDELYSLGFDNYLKYNEFIEKCSKHDIIRVAKEYLVIDKSCSIIIEPKRKDRE